MITSGTRATPPDVQSVMPCPDPYDLRRTLSPLKHGGVDRTIVFTPRGAWLGLRFATGAATLHLEMAAGGIVAEAWGAAAEHALAAAPAIAGLRDDPSLLQPRHRIVRELQARFAGLRLPATGQMMAGLVPAVFEQKVTSFEAHAAYARFLHRLCETAPGPAPSGLVVPPAPRAIAELPSFEYHPLGLERKRAELLRRIGRYADRIEAMAALPPAEARAALQTIPGIGPWTAAETTRTAFGDPDSVSVGDAHIPSMVAWALAGEQHADDARMLELLEPYAGQRARVVRLMEAAGLKAPRRGPRFAPRSITRI